MSRLDEIKARYGWCERCANHDPRDRSDHGHLRSQTEIDALWLVEQVESLERWKFEACEVMSGLRELGKALGLGLGVQITGPAALAEVARLTAERDALAAQVARVESLAGQWERLAATAINPDSREWLQACAATLRECLSGWQKMHAALAGSEADHDMPTENWTCPRCNRELPAQVWVCDCVPSPQSTDPGCGCSTNPARARYADGDPAGCYCTCSDDAREGCEHEPDEPQPTGQEAYPADHGWTPSNKFSPGHCRVMLARYPCSWAESDHDPTLPPEDVDAFGYRRTRRDTQPTDSGAE